MMSNENKGIELTFTGQVAVNQAMALVKCKYPHLRNNVETWKDFIKNEEVRNVFAQLSANFWLKQHYLTGKNYTAVRWGVNYDRIIAQTYPFFASWTYESKKWVQNRNPYRIQASVFADG